MRISVAIDGPAGAGKSTIAKIVGKKFDLMYINTGAMYRAVALMAERKHIKPEEVEKLVKLVDTMEIHFENDDLVLNGINVQEEITMPEISAIVSNYASIPEVRSKLVQLQRNIAEKYNVIMDGRDIGTVVLKDSKCKFFLTASAKERANRRFKELTERGLEVNYDEILNEIEKYKKDIIFFGALDTLENAIKGGRVNPLAGKVMNALNLKVIIRIDEGLVKPIDKARGGVNSIKKALDYVKSHVNDEKEKTIIIAHANCPEKAHKIKSIIEEDSNFKEVLIASIGPIMGTFTAEGAILVAVL